MEEHNTLENGSRGMVPQTEALGAFGEDIHVFPIVGGGVLLVPASQLLEAENQAAIESTPLPTDQEHISEKETQPLGTTEGKPKRSVIPVLVVGFYVLSSMAMSLPYVIPLLFPPAVTITIISKSQTITASLTLSHIQGRVFQPMTLSQTKTVVTTGHGHQDATNASGLITFYNASPQEQTIDAGTLLTGADNVQVVTDQSAYLPGSVPPMETQVTVPAHAVNTGEAGNIKAEDITGICCRENVFVSNAAFSGGQDERNYHMVTQQDIQGAVSSLVPAATQMINQSFEKLGRPTETLIPPVCSQNIITDHQLGEAATTVTVTLKKSCLAGAYDRNDYASQVIKALSQQAGKGYVLTAYLALSPVQVVLKQRTLALHATYQATLPYHFSQAEQSAFLGKIKGKSSKQAIQILSSLPGVAQVTITTPANQDTLPTDAASIHVVIMHVPC